MALMAARQVHRIESMDDKARPGRRGRDASHPLGSGRNLLIPIFIRQINRPFPSWPSVLDFFFSSLPMDFGDDFSLGVGFPYDFAIALPFFLPLAMSLAEAER